MSTGCIVTILAAVFSGLAYGGMRSLGAGTDLAVVSGVITFLVTGWGMLRVAVNAARPRPTRAEQIKQAQLDELAARLQRHAPPSDFTYDASRYFDAGDSRFISDKDNGIFIERIKPIEIDGDSLPSPYLRELRGDIFAAKTINRFMREHGGQDDSTD